MISKLDWLRDGDETGTPMERPKDDEGCDARGHSDGDTLVVETTNFRADSGRLTTTDDERRARHSLRSAAIGSTRAARSAGSSSRRS